MTTKLTVLYGPPAEHEALEEYYSEGHIPLVAKMAGAER